MYIYIIYSVYIYIDGYVKNWLLNKPYSTVVVVDFARMEWFLFVRDARRKHQLFGVLFSSLKSKLNLLHLSTACADVHNAGPMKPPPTLKTGLSLEILQITCQLSSHRKKSLENLITYKCLMIGVVIHEQIRIFTSQWWELPQKWSHVSAFWFFLDCKNGLGFYLFIRLH